MTNPLKKFFSDALGLETKEDKEKEEQERFRNEGEMAFMPEQEPTKEEKKQDKEKEWADVNQDYEYVCQGGTVMCKYHSAGDAKLMPTSTEVMLQDKPYVTEADTDGKTNFLFTGLCTHSSHGSQKPPCKAVVNLDKWKNCSTSYIDDYHPILFKSTIACMISGEDLKVTNSGQVNRPENIEPEVWEKPRIIDIYWRNQKEERVSIIDVDENAELYIRTKGYEEGEIITIELTKPESKTFESGEKILSLSAKINKEGIAIIKNTNWT